MQKFISLHISYISVVLINSKRLVLKNEQKSGNYIDIYKKKHEYSKNNTVCLSIVNG